MIIQDTGLDHITTKNSFPQAASGEDQREATTVIDISSPMEDVTADGIATAHPCAIGKRMRPSEGFMSNENEMLSKSKEATPQCSTTDPAQDHVMGQRNTSDLIGPEAEMTIDESEVVRRLPTGRDARAHREDAMPKQGPRVEALKDKTTKEKADPRARSAGTPRAKARARSQMVRSPNRRDPRILIPRASPETRRESHPKAMGRLTTSRVSQQMSRNFIAPSLSVFPTPQLTRANGSTSSSNTMT